MSRLYLIVFALALLALALGGWTVAGVRRAFAFSLRPRIAAAGVLGIALLPRA